MGKAFTKGEPATLIHSWDGKGTFVFRQVVVHSCGAKQMILTDEATGEELREHFTPAVATGWASVADKYHRAGTFKRLTTEEATAMALELAAAHVVVERARYADMIARSEGKEYPGYVSGLRDDLAALHEPRAMDRAAAVAIVHAAIKLRAGA